MKDNNLLSLVGLGRENMLITSNEKLLEDMNKVANEIYKEVQDYFSHEEVKDKLVEISKILCENEVIYDFEAVYNGEKDEGSIEKNLEKLVEKPVEKEEPIEIEGV